MQPTDLSHGRGWLDAPAARSVARIDAELGHPLDINEAGRSFFQQQKFYEAWLNGTGAYALSPYAPSIHQVGAAIDTDEQNTPVLNRHGWFHTVFWPNGSLREPWHYEYDASRDQHINEGNSEMNSEEWRQFQVLAANVNKLVERVDNINAWISEGGPGVTEAAAKPGTVAARVINLDRQVTGADNFGKQVGPTVAERLIDVQQNVAPPK